MSYRRAGDKYHIGRPIYNHESCTIYEATEVATGNPIIIKALTTDGEGQTNSILDESTIQMRLQHPNICEVFGVYLNGYTVNIAMERMKSDLEAAVKERQRTGQPFSEAEIVEMLRQVSEALCFAKQKRIAHRDIKPANIFIAEDNYYKVGDFGSALQVISSRDMKHTMTGTPLYLSPQLVAGYMMTLATGDNQVEYDPHKADVYALGITALYMARGGNMRGLLPLLEKVDVMGAVWELPCSDWLKQLLIGMLQEQEESRFDIEYVLTLVQPSQQDIQQYASSPTVGVPQNMPPQSGDVYQTVSNYPPQPSPITQTVDPSTFYGYCSFCPNTLFPHTRRFHFVMKCGHTACTQRCYDTHTALGKRCPLCLERAAT